MNLSNIAKGQEVRNYNSMCELIEEPIKNKGKSRLLQLENWKQYFEYKKNGHKFIIGDILSRSQIEKNSRKLTFITYIEMLILENLISKKNKGKIFLSKGRLLKLLYMINANYGECKRRPEKLSELIEVDKDNTYEFYEFADKTLKRNLEKALNNLRNKGLIYWSSVMTVCFHEAIPDLNTFNKVKVNKIFSGKDEFNEDIYNYETRMMSNQSYRLATDKEIDLVLDVEHQVIKYLDCINKQEVIRKGLWNKYKQQIGLLIMEKGNIEFYYDSYLINCNYDHIVEEFNRLTDQIKINDPLQSVNEAIVNQLNNNAEKRFIKAKSSLTPNNKEARRSQEKYLIDMQKLSSSLINKNSSYIAKEVKRVIPSR
ncbi:MULTISPECIES: hypothetical protein [Paenibacillus]|uniref:hypothetical protein n=1 Tax=Paenibacillus TaxID=44249 RepID=UPI00096D1B1B|nr:hypothetical protein [Paenibacillus odorifer]OMD66204.1 hypothetical protein BSK50_30780 [Paenibacillus odorifer]